ncbi:hypothetical protein C8Q80DRAFT_632698 [Daedaleopsis nitida]|nr:hypothetical protein C8Q80DRAFT_632698 [Daedaleopsis nitida]
MNETHSAATQATAVQKRPTFDVSTTTPRRSTTNTNAVTHTTSRTSRRSSALRTLSMLAVPERKIGPPPTFIQGLKAIILGSWLNVLLLFIPVSVRFIPVPGIIVLTLPQSQPVGMSFRPPQEQ